MSATVEEDQNFKKILAYLLKSKGFDGHHYKPNYVKRRVAVRMRATRTTTYQDYLHLLQSDRQEPSNLFDRLTIHVTEFFRDPNVYRALREKVLPAYDDVLENKLKIWCAGCSTGEEPYSVAISLEEWAFARPGFSFDILATDIDAPSVRTGEKGEYPVESIRKLTRAQTGRCFHVDGSTARVAPHLKRSIHFRVHDLLGKWPDEISGFHILFCRNLLIYLTAPQQQKIYEKFAKALVPGGFLVLGLTETLLGPSRKFFQCVDIKNRIYRALEKEQASLTGSDQGEKNG